MTTTQQPSAVERAAALLREAAHELAVGVSINGTPDWENEPDTKVAYDEHMAAAEALINESKKEQRGRLWIGHAQHNAILAMQAAYIEWKHGRGAEEAMRWVANTLWGPGLLPPADEKDAQAFFDRLMAVEDERVNELEGKLA